jgi:hypothetical protein
MPGSTDLCPVGGAHVTPREKPLICREKSGDGGFDRCEIVAGNGSGMLDRRVMPKWLCVRWAYVQRVSHLTHTSSTCSPSAS